MNQILKIKLNEKQKLKSKIFKFQLYCSLLMILFLLIWIVVYFTNLYTKEKLATSLAKNYNIYKLYSSKNEISDNNETDIIIGRIEIPKLNIYYPIFSNLNEDLLKIAPCKFYGNNIGEYGNICIAGHNYNNNMFFSKIFTLEKDDLVFVYDNNNIKYSYLIENVYEVSSSDLSPIYNYNNSEKLLTLVTCNNFNSNRFIVKCKLT